MKYLTLSLFLICISGLILSSCKKELSIDNTDKNYSLTLQRDTTASSTRFFWNKSVSSHFKAYILVRSNSQISNGQVPSIGNNTVKIVAEITDPNITEFTDLEAPFSKALHYKLYLDTGERLIESKDVIDFQNVFVFKDVFKFANFDPDSSWVYLFSQQSEIILFDYAQNKILKENILGGVTQSPEGPITTAYEGNSKKLFVGGNPYLYKINATSLIISKTISSYHKFFSLISNNNKLLISTNDNEYYSINVWNHPNAVRLNYSGVSNYSDPRLLVMLEQGSNYVAEISKDGMKSFNVDQSTGSINIKLTTQFDSSLVLLPRVVSTKDLTYFIPDVQGNIFSADLKLVATANIPNAKDFSFSDDNQNLYVASNLEDDAKIGKLHFPEMSIQKEIQIPSLDIKRIKCYNNSVVVYGRNRQTGEYMIRKIEIK